MISQLLPPKKAKFFTTGFTDLGVADLKPLLANLDAVLVDIRMSPYSKSVQWNREYLKILLKGKYQHLAQLGNRHSENEPIAIQHLALGTKILVSFGMNAVLLCECAGTQSCHRLIIAQELRRQGHLVEELDSWKLPTTKAR